jgi:hypothetical protein
MKTLVVLLSKTYFPQHPKAGKPTMFCEKVLNEFYADKRILPVDSGNHAPNYKKHTCRKNFEYWSEKVEKLKAENGVLSVRELIGKPYQKPGQNTIIDIPAKDIEVQKLTLWINKRTDIYAVEEIAPIHTIYEWEANVNSNKIPISVLASNDGLTVDDFKAWFAPVFESEKTEVLDFAIIHFTKFRY